LEKSKSGQSSRTAIGEVQLLADLLLVCHHEHASDFAEAPGRSAKMIFPWKSGVCLLRLRLFLCFVGARCAASPRAPMGGRRWSSREDEVGEKEEKE
jgi:hypothetical protein